jgi:hypothetical protein
MTANIALGEFFTNWTRYDDINDSESECWDDNRFTFIISEQFEIIFFSPVHVVPAIPVHMVNKPDDITQAVDLCDYYNVDLVNEHIKTKEWQNKLKEEHGGFIHIFA